MITFIRLVDGSTIVGKVISSNEVEVNIENALIVDSGYTESIEQKYFFLGMYLPFSQHKPIISTIRHNNIIAMHNNVEPYLEKQYNKYIKSWFKAKDAFLNVSESSDKQITETVEAMAELLLANTSVH